MIEGIMADKRVLGALWFRSWEEPGLAVYARLNATSDVF